MELQMCSACQALGKLYSNRTNLCGRFVEVHFQGDFARHALIAVSFNTRRADDSQAKSREFTQSMTNVSAQEFATMQCALLRHRVNRAAPLSRSRWARRRLSLERRVDQRVVIEVDHAIAVEVTGDQRLPRHAVGEEVVPGMDHATGGVPVEKKFNIRVAN
jgi:hypothetical protein